MIFIADNQLFLILACFCIGLVGTGFLLRKPAGHRAWKFADLVWVLLGGIGALAAVIAGIYKSDSSHLERQIDVAYAATSAFDRDAARFRLRFCDPAYDTDIAVLCDKVEFLSASTAGNAELPLFIAVTDEVAPLQGISFLAGSKSAAQEMTAKAATADAFDPEAFLIFTALDEPTEAAVENLRRRIPTIAGDFVILAQAYEDLIAQIQRLKQEWDYLQDNAYILVLQLFALCLVGFAAPFRLGKSVVELRQSGR
ncbi:hypothetical protein [Pseudophaeobacter sp. EL27]|uniref:hypothetical protein n=1 Tax=Pseudophaeobacter sp. EL27 TaxID=2107580 RepID=UPI000EFB8EF3|nr:hypothetical protein [Pseudophaeobacter sp. EL27]